MMRYLALACDYDGTLTADGKVDHAVISALGHLIASGRKVILVTGRQLDDLLRILPEIDIFDRVVCEDGALLYNPSARVLRTLTVPSDRQFVDSLRRRGVTPLHVGKCIVSTRQPNEEIVAQTINDLQLELQVTLNKGAVMILPPGINKGTGLDAALQELGLSAQHVVGVGDAENDQLFLSGCRCSVVVANALPELKEKAAFVTNGSAGDGVLELIQKILDNDLSGVN